MDRRNFLRLLGFAPVALVGPKKAYSFLGGIFRPAYIKYDVVLKPGQVLYGPPGVFSNSVWDTGHVGPASVSLKGALVHRDVLERLLILDACPGEQPSLRKIFSCDWHDAPSAPGGKGVCLTIH